MMFLGNSFAVPSFLAFVDFFAWALVFSRMANLGLPWWQRALVFLWASATLALAIVDVSGPHHFDSQQKAFGVIVLKSGIRIGNLGMAMVVYSMIGRLYPSRMLRSPHEEPHEVENGVV